MTEKRNRLRFSRREEKEMNEIITITNTELRQIEKEIKEFQNTMAYSILEIGDRLIRVKEAMPHGMFTQWVEENVNMSTRSANNYMRASRAFDTMTKRKAIADFEATKVLLLAELPEETRDDFIETVPVKDMTTRDLKEQIKREKESADVRKYFARTDSEMNDCFEIEISKLKPLPEYDNFSVEPRTGREYIGFLNSLDEVGQLVPILITKNNIIINGHERVRALRDLGHKTVTAHYLHVTNFYEGEGLNQVCLRYFLDMNRWDNSRTSLFYYYGALYNYTIWNFDEGHRLFDIFVNEGEEIDRKFREETDRIERLLKCGVPVQKFYESNLPLEEYLVSIGA